MHAKLRTNTKTTSETCWEKSCNWVSMRLHSITNTSTCIIRKCLLILDVGYYDSPFPSSLIVNVRKNSRTFSLENERPPAATQWRRAAQSSMPGREHQMQLRTCGKT